MVSSISSRSVPRPPLRRGWARLRTPYVAVVGALIVLGAITVAVGVATSDPETSTVACAQSDEATTAGLQPQDAGALRGVEPAKLDAAPVRVLNANGQSGQASQVAKQLGELGFAAPQNNPVGNDPLYPKQDLTCHGQIRYGDEGRATAATLLLVAPCMQLMHDARPGTAVDLALGSYFKDLTGDRGAQDAIRSLQEGHKPSADQMNSATAIAC